MYSAAYTNPSETGFLGIFVLTMPHVISDTCILQVPSKSNIIQISQVTSRRGAALQIPVINPRLHPVPLHQVRQLRRAVKLESFCLSRISGTNTGTLGGILDSTKLCKVMTAWGSYNEEGFAATLQRMPTE